MSQENEKWMLEVGQLICAEKSTGEWVEAEVLKLPEEIGRPIPCRQNNKTGCLFYAWNYKPTQTQSDKYQDEQIEKIKNACLNVARADNHYEALYDIGVRVLGPDDVICKPLSQDVRREIAQDLGITISDVMAVERELKLIEGW